MNTPVTNMYAYVCSVVPDKDDRQSFFDTTTNKDVSKRDHFTLGLDGASVPEYM
jgi:hypothetical protein